MAELLLDVQKPWRETGHSRLRPMQSEVLRRGPQEALDYPAAGIQLVGDAMDEQPECAETT